MIGKLSGIIDSLDTDHFILDVSGVGYLIYASSRTLSNIGQVGDNVSVLIITNVREDAITLYGFADIIEQQWFKLLTSVQGVGAKAGLSILAACPADQLSFVIASGDKASLTKADGVGPKIAARILTELKDKAGKIDITGSSVSQGISNLPTSDSSLATDIINRGAVCSLRVLCSAASDAYT